MALFCNSVQAYYIDPQVMEGTRLLEFAEAHPKNTFAVISHGRPGQLLINGRWLGANQLLSMLREALKKEQGISQINLYGCEFAKGHEGKAAVAYLESALGLNIAASEDITGKGGNWALEAGSSPQTVIGPSNYPYKLQYAASDDFDGDGIINALDLDDDNDGILDTEEMLVSAPVCTLHYPDNATFNNPLSETVFPADRGLANTYDNDLSTFGGAGQQTAQLLGTVTYNYNTPINNVTEFQFYSNGGSVLNDGQVTHIASIRFYNSSNVLLYQQDNVIIPQASITTPFVVNFTTTLQDVASFTLTDLSDDSNRPPSAKEAIWKEVNLMSCTTPELDRDTDNDGIANRFDLDSDGDGCPDSQEASVVSGFAQVPFANVGIVNISGVQPAVLSQISKAVFRDLNANGFDDRLETAAEGSYSGTYSYERAINSTDAVCLKSLDSDADGIADEIDLDDDNDGILDTVESGPAICTLNYPTGATSNIPSSATIFPAGRSLENTYDNNLGTFGGTTTRTTSLIGTITYTYNVPLNSVTEFQFFSNGGTNLTDGQVTNIASARFYDSAHNLLHQAANLIIPQASVSTPFILTFPQPLNGVASFELTDLTDQTHGGSSEAIWKDVNLKTCTNPADLDTDGDGIVNRLDLDSDGDGCPDSQEAAVVSSFGVVQFANINVINSGGTSAASQSQVASGTFQDINANGFDDRFENITAGTYMGTYSYEKALDNTIAACTPLPVTLISFAGKLSSEGNILHWETAQEKGFDRFSIEKSHDAAGGFASIGEVKGGSNHYRFTDNTTSKGSSYYRLKMIDLDGSFTYSRIIYLYQPYGENEHTIFPNPGPGRTVYIYNYFPIESFRIYDMKGKQVSVKMTKYADRYQFNIDPKVVPGVYILEYRAGNDLIRRNFVLN